MEITNVISLKGKQKLYGTSLENEEAKNVVYVGRNINMGGWRLKGSTFCNPKLELPEYEKYIRKRLNDEPGLYEELMTLKGKDLACWCVSKTNIDQCHAVILKNIINEDANKFLFKHITDKLHSKQLDVSQLLDIINILNPSNQLVEAPYIAVKKRKIANLSLLDTTDKDTWMNAYNLVQVDRLKPGYYNYSKKLMGKPTQKPTIHVVRRVRGGDSYKSVQLNDLDGNTIPVNDIFWVPSSKGYSFSDISPYVIGPIIGHGINILNAVWSKHVTVGHLNGKFNLNSKNFWKKSSKDVDIDDIQEIFNSKKWYIEWKKWSDHVALCGDPAFNWVDNMGLTIAYVKNKDVNINTDSFYKNEKEFHRDTYEKWLSEAWDNLESFKYLYRRFTQDKVHIALIHPIISSEHDMSIPITAEYMEKWIQDGNLMNTPMLLAMKLISYNWLNINN